MQLLALASCSPPLLLPMGMGSVPTFSEGFYPLLLFFNLNRTYFETCLILFGKPSAKPHAKKKTSKRPEKKRSILFNCQLHSYTQKRHHPHIQKKYSPPFNISLSSKSAVTNMYIVLPPLLFTYNLSLYLQWC